MELINNKTTKKELSPKLNGDTGLIEYKGIGFVKEDILELSMVLSDAISVRDNSKINFSSLVLNYEIVTSTGGRVLLTESDIMELTNFYTSVILDPNIATRSDQ